MHAVRPLVLSIVTTLALAACTGPGGVDDVVDATPSMTASETEQVVEGMTTDMQGLQAGLTASPTFQALSYATTFPTGMSALQSESDSMRSVALARAIGTLAADTSLERGIYEYNPSNGQWENVGTSADLVVRWSFVDGNNDTRNAQATLDWSVSEGTVEAVESTGSTTELPRDARLTVTLDGTEVSSFDFDAAWRSTDCGTTDQPNSLLLDGYVGDSAARIDLDELALSMLESGSIRTSGDVRGTAGSDEASFGWNIALDGSFVSDESGCFWTDYDVTSGSAELRASTTNHSMVFGFDFDNLVYDEFGSLVSVDLANGYLRADGETALTFDGTLDDENGDGVYGDNLVLTFDGETLTLEAFTKRQEFIARGGAALKTLGILR